LDGDIGFAVALILDGGHPAPVQVTYLAATRCAPIDSDKRVLEALAVRFGHGNPFLVSVYDWSSCRDDHGAIRRYSVTMRGR
jgi:hypothetical protein